MEEQAFSVYTLSDPRTGQVRYVGMSNNVEIRYSTHLVDRCNATKIAWIQELKVNQLAPVLSVIETELTLDVAKKRELHWIRYHLDQGMPLVNISGVPAGFAKGVAVSSKVEAEPKPPEYLRVPEVAILMNRTPDTVRRKLRNCEIPAYTVGNGWLVKVSDLQVYLKQRKNQAE